MRDGIETMPAPAGAVLAADPVRADVMDLVEGFETSIIPHDALDAAKGEIARLHARCRPPGKRRLKARALVVAGESGSGKTTLLESYLEDHPADETGVDGDIRPVVYVEAPKKPTQRQFVSAIMGALGYRVRETWDTSEIIAKIGVLCDEMRVRVIMIDEAHHLVEHVNPEREEDLSEFLKSLLNRCRVQVVLAGLPSLLRLTHYSQLRRRLQPPVVLRPYDWTTVEGRGQFMALVAFYEAQLGLPTPSNLSAHAVAKRLYCASGGHIGLVSKYLSEAIEQAHRRGARNVDLALLADVHDSFSVRRADSFGLDPDAKPVKAARKRDHAKGNPFSASDADFVVLWGRMAKERQRMGEAADRRRPRHVGSEMLYDYDARFAA